MSKPKVGINGFGRIGRLSLRTSILTGKLDIVAINDPGDVKQAAHLLEWDSVYGHFDAKIEVIDGHIVINGNKIHYTNIMDPTQIPWKEHGADIILECTGIFEEKEAASKHLVGGAKKVVISAPGKGVDGTFCMGVNDELYDPANHHIISNASCTTNCIAPCVQVLEENFKIVKGLMTTIHSYTNDQKLTDASHKKDFRRARAANLSIIPTVTGAAKALGDVIPSVKGKLDGLSLRVPTPTVSMIDLVCEVEKQTTIEEVNEAFVKASTGKLKGILDVTTAPLVSIDFRGNNFSAILDAPLTNVIGGNMVKIMAWYDNEWGYTMRLIEIAEMVGKGL